MSSSRNISVRATSNWKEWKDQIRFPKVIAQVLKLDFDTVIPGHGNDPMTRADLVAYQKTSVSPGPM